MSKTGLALVAPVHQSEPELSRGPDSGGGGMSREDQPWQQPQSYQFARVVAKLEALEEQFRGIRLDVRERNDELKLTLNSRLGQIEMELGKLDAGKADKSVQTIVYAAVGFILLTFLGALVGLVMINRGSSGAVVPLDPPPAIRAPVKPDKAG